MCLTNYSKLGRLTFCYFTKSLGHLQNGIWENIKNININVKCKYVKYEAQQKKR